jgi:hypothetical protein
VDGGTLLLASLFLASAATLGQLFVGDGGEAISTPAALGDPAPIYSFQDGFAALKDQLGDLMGQPVEAAHHPDVGGAQAVQKTTRGLAVYYAGAAPQFTDGERTWWLGYPEQTEATVGIPEKVAEPAAPVPAEVANSPPSSVWTRVAACESSGRWATNSGNGYYGGLQEDMNFWRRYGGLAFAPRPDLATPAQQIIVAERGLAVQGPGAWPVCSRVAGLR